MATILVIVEAVDQRQTWRQLFAHAGYAVIDARTVREGLHYCQTHSIDLAVMGLRAPVRQGLADIRLLRPGVPVLGILCEAPLAGQIDRAQLVQDTGVDAAFHLPVSDAIVLAAVGTRLTRP
jgi:DNA-binding response OmpR family regulator